MFPLEFPLSYLKGAQPGDWVLDPFCGRGTTLYAARLRGLPASGVDVSPVAAAMAAAQLSTASMGEVLQLLQELLKGKTSEVPAGDFWTLAYHPKTLESLVRLRRSEEHTSELQSRENLVCRLLLEKKKKSSSLLSHLVLSFHTLH